MGKKRNKDSKNKKEEKPIKKQKNKKKDLNNNKKEKKIIKLKCNHILCSDCYHKWCKIKETCPMCRRKMFNTPAEDPDFENLLRSLYDNRTFLFQKSY